MEWKEVRMSKRCFTSEQVIGILRQADVELSRGKHVGQVY